jgi:hypothetical protein
VYWTHDDSETAPEIYAVDSATGETVATITLTGTTFRDVEAISLGPDGDLWVGDIGDNLGGTWPEVWIYRFPEPADLADATVAPTVYTVAYADGPRDAEALMVDPGTGRVYIASKVEDGPAALYGAPDPLTETGVNTFERVADIDLWVTDGAFSPDGTRLLLRGYFGAQMYRWADGVPTPLDQRVVPPLQAQGESVTFTPDGRALMFGSEGPGSAVEPVELSGALRPDDVAAGDEAADEDGGGNQAGGGDGGDSDGNRGGVLTGGAIVVVIVLAALLSRRRRPGGGG